MKYFLKLAFCLISIHTYSQLTVTIDSNPTSLAQKITGSGITVSGATLNCGAQAAGTFIYSGVDLGISKGIILTTGAATDAANPGAYFCDVMNGNMFSDPNLVAVDPDATNDVCILEFDMIPLYNSIKITFILGSEEYPNFVGSFNDGVGIFFTGPNPSGGNYSAANIGVLPSGTPVSINNVNATTNPTYFHDNYTNSNSDIAYGGYTIPITTTVSVVPHATYHIKFAIADALDEAYDSGLFIQDSLLTSCLNVPVVVFDTLGFSDTVCLNSGSYTLTGGYPTGGSYNGISVSGNSFTASSVGTFYITYIYTDSITGCVNNAQDSVIVLSCGTLINKLTENNQIIIYPNPAKNVLYINNMFSVNSSIEIYNVSSQKVISQKTNNTTSQVNIENLSSGIYFVRLINLDGLLYQTKFIKE